MWWEMPLLFASVFDGRLAVVRPQDGRERADFKSRGLGSHRSKEKRNLAGSRDQGSAGPRD